MLEGDCFASIKAGKELVTADGEGCYGHGFIFGGNFKVHPNCLKCRFFTKLGTAGDFMISDLNNAMIMQTIKEIEDPEVRHAEADNLLCEILSELGYYGTVAVFESMEKWYS